MSVTVPSVQEQSVDRNAASGMARGAGARNGRSEQGAGS